MSKRSELLNHIGELNKNTEILNHTFNNIGVEVIQYSWTLTQDNDGSCICFVEFTGNLDNMDNSSFYIKINLYDENGFIFCSEDWIVIKSDFSGYDTKKFYFTEKNIVQRASKARIYAIKG